MTDANALADELEAKLAVCEREGLTFKAGWNLIRATITALRTADKHQQALAERDAEIVRLREALGRCRRIVETNLHRQDEKVGDVVHVVNAALGGTDANNTGENQ